MAHIFVVGMHRSGTSTVTGLLHLIGAWVGEPDDLIGANDENPKGFFERRDVIELNDAMLNEHGCTWYHLSDWPDTTAAPLSDALSARKEAIISTLNAQEHWAIKDPRLCHTLPYWVPEEDSNAVVLLVHRHPVSVARSLQKRNGLPLQVGLAIWEASALQLLRYRSTYHCVEINYEELIASPDTSIRSLCESLALPTPDASATEGFIDPTLNRSQHSESDDLLSARQEQLLEWINTGETPKDDALKLSNEATLLMGIAGDVLTLHEQLETVENERDRALNTIKEHEDRLDEAIKERDQIKQQAQAEVNRLHGELEAIKNTRTWKLRCKLVGEK